MNISEAAVICSGLALVRVENLKFVSDIGDIIKHKILDAEGLDLVLLAKGTFYLRKFKHSKDIYSEVHARAMSLYNLRQLDPDVIAALSKVYDEHQVFTDSPFITTRFSR